MIFGKHINKYYIKYAPSLLLGVFALVIVDCFQLKVPELYKMVINGVNMGKVELDGTTYNFDMDFLLDKICLPLIFVIVAMVFGRFLWRICFFGAGIKVETDLRRRMFEHSKDLSQQYYHVNKVGTLMSLFTNDIETVQDCFGSGILMLADAILLGTLAIYKMARMSWFLTVLSLIPMLLLFVIGAILDRSMMKKWETRQEAFSKLSDFSQENFSGIAVIKAYVKEYLELNAFRKLNKENEDANVEYTRISTTLNVLVIFLVESVICIILGYGGYLVYIDRFNAGELVEFISYFTSIVWPVMAVSQLIEMQARGKASLKRIGELLDAKQDVVDKAGAEDIGIVKGDIEFKNLTFAFPEANYNALKNVSFKINAGENVGIIGKTGSGKTTIVDLILRTYNVPDDAIFIDGHDVNSITIESVRKNLAYVPQDNFLFSDTISNNISFASDDNNIDDIINAARLSVVHKNIEDFKDGYETVLGERGVTVSGGQKQRISIARALMKNSPILILDDSVSAVDTKTEKAILENLRTERNDKTTILIAHRISTIENMDKVIFIDDGEVIAVGSHNELVEKCDEYRTMVELQKLEDERGGNSDV